MDKVGEQVRVREKDYICITGELRAGRRSVNGRCLRDEAGETTIEWQSKGNLNFVFWKAKKLYYIHTFIHIAHIWIIHIFDFYTEIIAHNNNKVVVAQRNSLRDCFAHTHEDGGKDSEIGSHFLRNRCYCACI